MENNEIIIRAKRLPSAFNALISLIFLFASIYCVILPATDTLSGPLANYIKIAYLVVGCIGIVFFGYKTTFHIIKLISPPKSVIITDEGIVDYTIPDGGIAYVSWDNVADIKLFGDKKCDWLGISLRTTQKVFMGLSKAARAEISDNIDAGMPAIIIKANDISIDIYDLRAMINEQLGALKTSSQTRVMHNKPSVSQVYGVADEKEVYKDDNFIIEPRLKNDDEYDTGVYTTIADAVTTEPEASTNELAETRIIDEKEAYDSDMIVLPNEKRERLDTRTLTLEIDESVETWDTMPKPKSGERFFESSKRPTKKSELNKSEEDNIDDILSALSTVNKKGNK